MKLEARIMQNKAPETIKQVSGKIIELRRREELSRYTQKPTANYFGAGLNNLTSYLDD